MKKMSPTSQKLAQLLPLFEDAATMLIVLQDYPDPDAIASAAALRALANGAAGVQCFIAHGGMVGRAENRAMVKYLDLHLHALTELDLSRFDLIAMVDTQPGTGNNSLPGTILPDIVMDHHPIRRLTRSAAFTDIRSRYGATATILYEYLRESRLTVEPSLATALLYGIKSDTYDLGRETTRTDMDAYLALFPAANKRALGRIQAGGVPLSYFQVMARGLSHARTYGKAIVTSLDDVDNPDMIAEVADLLLRHEDSTWSLSHGVYRHTLLFSIRASEPDAQAGRLAQRIAGKTGTGGGHSALAAGQIPLKEPSAENLRKRQARLVRHFLKALRIPDQDGKTVMAS